MIEPRSHRVSQALSDRFGATYTDRFARILEIILSDEEIALLLATPGRSAELAWWVKRDGDAVAASLQDLFMRGMIFITRYVDGEPIWDLIDLGRFMDSILFDPSYDRFGDEFFDLFREFQNEDFIPNQPPHDSLRILPIDEVIRSTRVLDSESTRAIVRNSRRIAVQRCPCRTRERRCDAPLEVCLGFDGLADYALKRGFGREIGKDEALAILKSCEDLGLVHETVNSDRPDVICNCCTCCCSLLRSVVTHGIRTAVVASRFRPEVDEGKCESCLTCVDACHFSAMVAVDGRREFDAERCYGCALCAVACPHEAIAMGEAYPPEHIPSNGIQFNLSLLPPEA